MSDISPSKWKGKRDVGRGSLPQGHRGNCPSPPHLIHKPFVANCYLCRVFWVLRFTPIYAHFTSIFFSKLRPVLSFETSFKSIRAPQNCENLVSKFECVIFTRKRWLFEIFLLKNEIPAQNYPRPPIKLTLTEWYVQSEKKQKFNIVTPSHISKTER